MEMSEILQFDSFLRYQQTIITMILIVVHSYVSFVADIKNKSCCIVCRIIR